MLITEPPFISEPVPTIVKTQPTRIIRSSRHAPKGAVVLPGLALRATVCGQVLRKRERHHMELVAPAAKLRDYVG